MSHDPNEIQISAEGFQAMIQTSAEFLDFFGTEEQIQRGIFIMGQLKTAGDLDNVELIRKLYEEDWNGLLTEVIQNMGLGEELEAFQALTFRIIDPSCN